jgi:hypothetical protein
MPQEALGLNMYSPSHNTCGLPARNAGWVLTGTDIILFPLR